MTAPLDIDGARLSANAQGVLLSMGWMYSQQISVADAVRIRDWLIAVYPVKLCECGAEIVPTSRT